MKGVGVSEHDSAEAAANCLGWLERLVGGPVSAQGCLWAAILSVICRDLNRELTPLAGRLASTFLGRVNDPEEAGKTLLALMANLGSTNLGLPQAAGFSRLAAATASALSDVGPESLSPSFRPPWFLLARLGHLPPLAESSPGFTPDPYALLLGDRALVAESVDAYWLWTCLGVFPLSVEEGFLDVLEAACLHFIRRRRFDLCMRLLRMLAHLSEGRESMALNMARHFLLTNQTPEGSFGFVDADSQAVFGSDSPEVVLDAKLELSLEFLWSLAEMDLPGYRVFRDLGKYSHRAPTVVA